MKIPFEKSKKKSFAKSNGQILEIKIMFEKVNKQILEIKNSLEK